MSQHHREDVDLYARYGRARNVTNAVLDPGMTRGEALRVVLDRIKRAPTRFFYDARNGRASWI